MKSKCYIKGKKSDAKDRLYDFIYRQCPEKASLRTESRSWLTDCEGTEGNFTG